MANIDSQAEIGICNDEYKNGSTKNRQNDSKLIRLLKQMDMVIAVFCLSSMIVISMIQIIARNFFHKGAISDADIIVRHLVLWVVFLGAGIASRSNKHITMDLIQRILPPRAKNITNFTINIFSSGVSAILCYAAVYFVISEYHENQFISSINIPIWVIELIIPTGYAFISFYFFLNAISIIIQYAQRTSK